MRTVRDEAFFDTQALRRRVIPIGVVLLMTYNYVVCHVCMYDTCVCVCVCVCAQCSSSVWYI